MADKTAARYLDFLSKLMDEELHTMITDRVQANQRLRTTFQDIQAFDDETDPMIMICQWELDRRANEKREK